MDQTKFFQLRTALCILVCENKTVDTTMKPKDIHNWYHCIMKVALRLKASNNSNITWMECENNTFPIKESPCPRVAHVQPWRQITKSPYTNNTTRSNLTFNCVTVDFWEVLPNKETFWIFLSTIWNRIFSCIHWWILTPLEQRLGFPESCCRPIYAITLPIRRMEVWYYLLAMGNDRPIPFFFLWKWDLTICNFA